MGIEIERKFLVKGTPWELYQDVDRSDITQGYFSTDPNHVIRVRTSKDEASITIKGPGQLVRNEFEYIIPKADAYQLINMLPSPPISKTRYTFYDEHNQCWEVDVYKDSNKGLVVAEIELTSEDDVVILPTWAVKEVTNDGRYSNASIAEHGCPSVDRETWTLING